jgi:hypothetical protein
VGQIRSVAMSSHVDAISASYDAFHRRDIDGVLAIFAPDVSWVHPDGMNEFGLGGEKKGHSEVIAFIRRVPDYISRMTLAPHEFIEAGDRVVVFGVRHVCAANGREATFRFVHSWVFRDDKAIRFEDYFDTAQLIRLIADRAA